jgi:hypothetical protein
MKFRASQLGKLMTEPRSKSEVLSQTAKSYLEELAIEKMYGVKKDFSNKYTEKGNLCENQSLQLIDPFMQKNQHNFQNEWITGTPDVVEADFVLDVKTSWNIWTFPSFETEIPTKDYFYQLQAYMWLTERVHAKLCYCLVNTPEELIGYEPVEWHNFDHMPIEKRVKTFEFDLDLSVIEKFKQKCEVASEYFEKLIK